MDFFVFHENKFEMKYFGDGVVDLNIRDHLQIYDIFELNDWLFYFLSTSPFKDSHKFGIKGVFDPPHYWKRNGIYWFRKVVAINSLFDMNVIKTPYFIWVGCDTRFDKKLDDQFIKYVTQFDISHIDRKLVGNYTETDIIVFKVDAVLDFIHQWKNFYLNGNIFKEKRWDDCIAFDKTKDNFKELTYGSLLDKTGCPFNVYDYLFHWKRPLHKIRDKRAGIIT